MQLDLTVLTKAKKMIHYYGSHAYDGKTLSTHVCIILMQVSVPSEDGSQQSATFTHAVQQLHAHSCPSGSALSCPLLCPTAKHKQLK
jgi:hypothetical protein